MSTPSQLRQRASPREPASATASSLTPRSATGGGRGGGGTPSTPTVQSYTSFPTPAQVALDREAVAKAKGGVVGRGAPRFPSDADDEAAVIAKKKALNPPDRRSLAWTFGAFLLSAPALLGMCCWPSIVVAIVGGTVTGSARTLSHTISFWLTLSVLLCMLVYTAWCTRARSQLHSTHLGVYGPLYLLSFASLLVMADPLRHILQDGGVWDGPSSNAFRDGCGEGWGCLTTTGVLFCVLFTYIGFICMFTASLWNGNLLAKCRMCAREWRDIRQQHAEQALADANAAREAVALERLGLRRGDSPVPAPITVPSFGALHVNMAPPTFIYKAEESNKLGYISTSSPIIGGPDATTAASASPPMSATNRGSKRVGAHASSSSASSSTTAGSSSSAASSPVASTALPGGGGSGDAPGSSPSSSRSGDGSSSVGGGGGYNREEGYSYEVRSPAVVENIIKVGKGRSALASSSLQQQQAQQQQPHVSSPTVTGSPSSSSNAMSANQHHLFPAESPLSCGGGGGVGGMGGFGSPLSNVALTPANGSGSDSSFGQDGGSSGALSSKASPSSSSMAGAGTPPRRPPHTPHTPGQLDFPPATFTASPHAQPYVAAQQLHLKEASSPFNKQKWMEQQAYLEKQKQRGEVV